MITLMAIPKLGERGHESTLSSRCVELLTHDHETRSESRRLEEVANPEMEDLHSVPFWPSTKDQLCARKSRFCL